MVQGEIIFLDKLPTEAIHRKAKKRKEKKKSAFSWGDCY
jgi:hypothetical protein